MLLISSNVYCFIVCYYVFTILDYSSALEYSIIRRYTNIVYYYYYVIYTLSNFICLNNRIVYTQYITLLKYLI